MKRSLVLNTLASASLLLTAACSGDDGGGNADGSDSTATATAPDGGDDGNESPDDGNETPTNTPPDTGMLDTGSGDNGTGDTTDDGPDTGSDDTTGGVPACPYTPVAGNPSLALQLVADGFDRPMLAMGDPAQPDRLFVVEQGGTVKILEPGMSSAPAENFLEVSSSNAATPNLQPESGTLGFAFHPDWPDDGRVYVSYNRAAGGGTVIEEYAVDEADGSQVDSASARVVMALAQPAGNHNGGMIAFGPDGYLYIGMGDGGGGGDTYSTGRNPSQLLAKMLRIGVEPDGTPDNPVACDVCPDLGPLDYTLPADNPGVDGTRPGWAPEIFAMGLRNPWRFSIDVTNGEIVLADVGQNAWEEIDIITIGADYGWSDMEADHCFNGAPCATGAGLNQVNGDGITAPIYEYAEGCSITGGATYHSCEVPDWDGTYIFGDVCEEWIRAIRWDGSTTETIPGLPGFGEPMIGNGWNAWGDVFITTVTGSYGPGPSGNGKVYRLAPE